MALAGEAVIVALCVVLGWWAAAGIGPQLASDRIGRVSRGLVAVLLAGALAVLTLGVIRYFLYPPIVIRDLGDGLVQDTFARVEVPRIAFESAVLLAMSAIVRLLRRWPTRTTPNFAQLCASGSSNAYFPPLSVLPSSG